MVFFSDKFKFYNFHLDCDKKNQMMNYNEQLKQLSRKYNAQRMRRLNNRIDKFSR